MQSSNVIDSNMQALLALSGDEYVDVVSFVSDEEAATDAVAILEAMLPAALL